MPAPFNLRAVGVIRSPFVESAGTPIQPCYAQGAEGKVIVDEAFTAALDDIEGFEHDGRNLRALISAADPLVFAEAVQSAFRCHAR